MCRIFDEMYRNNQGLLLYGPVGTGKSYAAACIANELLNQKIPVIMTSFVKILTDDTGQAGGGIRADSKAEQCKAAYHR